MPIQWVNLPQAFELLQGVKEGHRIFSYVLDIELNFVIVSQEFTEAHRPVQMANWPANVQTQVIPAEHVEFFQKVHAQKCISAGVFRYRALFDKIMALFVLIGAPDQFERYDKARSKKRVFQKIAEEHFGIPPEGVQKFVTFLEDFDNLFRTPEAHGSGSIKKWIFADKLPFMESGHADLLKYQNMLTLMIHFIGGIFGPEETKDRMSGPLVTQFVPIWNALRSKLVEHRA